MKFRLAVFLLAFPLLLVRVAAAAPSADEQFLNARDAARTGDRARLERLTPELQGYELASYVDYWRLQLDLSTTDPATIKSFLARNDKTYIAEKLRSDWLKQLGKKQQWAEFDAEYPALLQPDQDLSCYALLSSRERGGSNINDEAMRLWRVLIKPAPPESCYLVFDSLDFNRLANIDVVWARIRLQIESEKVSAADIRRSMTYFPRNQMPESKTVAAAIDAPLPWLVKLVPNLVASRTNRELVALAISRVARNDPRIAAEQLARIESQMQASEKGWAWSQVGWQAAQRHMSDALDWYRKAGDAPLSDEVAQWKVRAALRAQDWGMVRTSIEKMPPALAEQPAWIYWLGRAYRAGGRIDDANTLFAKISGQPNFYGNLADEELDRPITTPPKAASPTREEAAAIAANPGVQRTLALFRIGLNSEGTREWNWVLRGMNDRELLAASDIAQRAGIFDQAIAAANRTRNEHDYSLRYLSPYNEQIRPAAKKQALDDAWVYGLMRQESRFVTNAKSPQGASGLMQLMPATAKWVARKIGLKDFHQGQVNDTETNVLLGTTYMRMVMESLDNHPVLASAAYNAGPGRARKWRGDQALEGAVYAETIPFSETRDYVKKVMSNSVYYSALFNEKPQSLKNRLGVIGPRTSVDPKAEELP